MTSIAGKVAVEPDKDDPWKGDKLDRKKFAEALKPILTDLDSPATIGLLGNWGSGKTNFLKRLRVDLAIQDDAPVVVYFDAWARDFSDDPFASFCAAIQEQLQANESTAQASSVEELRASGKKVLKTTIASAVRVGGKWVGEFIPLAGEMFSDGADALADKIQKAADEAPDVRDEFRRSLGRVVKALENGDTQRAGKCWLLIFVDELDRCRPDYAIRLLETIKHFFDVPGVSFLLAYDEAYLANAAKALYGQGFEAEQYLRKFVDVRFWLPPASRNDFILQLVEHYDFSDLFKQDSDQIRILTNSLIEWVERIGISLRDAEQALALCRIVAGRLRSASPAVVYPCLFCCIARFRSYDTVMNAIHGTGTFEDVANEFAKYFPADSMRHGTKWPWMSMIFRWSSKEEGQIFSYLNSPQIERQSFEYGALHEMTRVTHVYPFATVLRGYLNLAR